MNMKHLMTGLAAVAAAAALVSCQSIPMPAGLSLGGSDKFVGSETCKGCHLVEYKSWSDSLHSKMMRKKEDGILKDVVAKWNDGGPTKGNVTGRAAKLDDVQYVVGSYWKQRFLIKNEQTGGWQFMDKQFNRMSGKWEGYGQKNDWDTQCATCHTTGYKVTKVEESTGKVLEATMVEHNVGCEACHGPGGTHANSKNKKDIFGFKNASHDQQSMVCGYCHIRVDNHKYKTRQGNDSEHVPHPKAGESFKAGQDDWRKWYPEQLTAPGVHAEDPLDKEYTGDLKGMWLLDEQSKKYGFYDANKHHQQYQEFLQSKHYKQDLMNCASCHSAHASAGKPMIKPRETCKQCHQDDLGNVNKYMPATGKTAGDLFVRSHTFNKNQSRKGGAVASGTPVLQKGK